MQRPVAERLKNQVTVGIAELAVSAEPQGRLITYALGSCIAVILHDRVRRAAGMLHFMLPEASLNPDTARERPAMFADSGVPLLLAGMRKLGCHERQLVVTLAGGGALQSNDGPFRIGSRNQEAIEAILRDAGMVVRARDLGGNKSRTAAIEVATGEVTIRSQGGEYAL